MLECLLVVAILGVVAGWRFTPPPRALAAAIEAPLAVHIHTDNAMFQVLVSPGTVGRNSFVLQLMNGDASPLAAKEATLILSLPERGIEPLERTATLGATATGTAQRAASLSRPLASAHRCPGDGFSEDYTGRRFEVPAPERPFRDRQPHCDLFVP